MLSVTNTTCRFQLTSESTLCGLLQQEVCQVCCHDFQSLDYLSVLLCFNSRFSVCFLAGVVLLQLWWEYSVISVNATVDGPLKTQVTSNLSDDKRSLSLRVCSRCVSSHELVTRSPSVVLLQSKFVLCGILQLELRYTDWHVPFRSKLADWLLVGQQWRRVARSVCEQVVRSDVGGAEWRSNCFTLLRRGNIMVVK